MCVPGGPRILLDSEPRAPAPPTAPPPARPPRRGPRSGWRRASLRRGNLTVKNSSRLASLAGRQGGRLPKDRICVDHSWCSGTKVADIRKKGVDQ